MLQKAIKIKHDFLRKNYSLAGVSHILIILIIFFSFLASSNLLSFQRYYYIVLAISIVLYILLNRKIVIDLRFLLTFLFASSYFITYTIFNGFQIMFLFYPFYIVLLQQLIFSLISNDNDGTVIHLLIANALGFFLLYCLTIAATIRNQGIIFNGGFLTQFWHRENDGMLVRTGLSLAGLGILSLASFIIFEKSEYRNYFSIIISLLVILFTFITTIITTTRAFIIVVVLSLIIFSLKKFKRTNVKTIIGLLFFLSILGLLYFMMVKGFIRLPSALNDITIVRRFLDKDYNSDSARKNLYKIFFQNFYKFPFGGMNTLDSINYVHNLILDFYTFGGIVPLVLFVIFLIDLIYQMYKYKKLGYTVYYSLFFSFIIPIIILGLFEPLYNANPNSITPLFLIYYYLVYKNKRKYNNESKQDYF